jgi:hypothetical protein
VSLRETLIDFNLLFATDNVWSDVLADTSIDLSRFLFTLSSSRNTSFDTSSVESLLLDNLASSNALVVGNITVLIRVVEARNSRSETLVAKLSVVN